MAHPHFQHALFDQRRGLARLEKRLEKRMEITTRAVLRDKAHKDVALRNIFLNDKEKWDLGVKLGDFGSAALSRSARQSEFTKASALPPRQISSGRQLVTSGPWGAFCIA